MGQRLIVSLWDDTKFLASSYKHWSGITAYALDDTISILTRYLEMRKNNTVPENKTKLAVELLHCNNEGIHPNHVDRYIKKTNDTNYPKFINRSEGWIVLTKKDTEKSKLYDNISVDIDLYNQTFDGEGLFVDFYDLCDRDDFNQEDKYELFNLIEDVNYTLEHAMKLMKLVAPYYLELKDKYK